VDLDIATRSSSVMEFSRDYGPKDMDMRSMPPGVTGEISGEGGPDGASSVRMTVVSAAEVY